jgi:O-antigen/teichoic acid export membrane protein
MDFSKWLLAANLLNFINTRADRFMIGKFVSVQSLGVYSVAHEIATATTSELLAPIRRAIFPGFSKMVARQEELRGRFMDVLTLTTAIALPIAAGIGLVADPMVRVVLGEKWLQSIPLIQVLVVYGMASIATVGVAPLLLALGRPRLLARFSTLSIAILIPSMVFGIYQAQALGAALAVSFTSLVLLVVRLSVASRAVNVTWFDILGGIRRTLIATAGMAAIVLGARALVPHTGTLGSSVVELVLSVSCGAIVYLGVHLGLWRLAGCPDGPEPRILAAVRRGLGRHTANTKH